MTGAGSEGERAATGGATPLSVPSVEPLSGPLSGPLAAPLAATRVPFRGRTRLVAGAKVLLPLAALALLSTLFLLARDPEGPALPADLPFARIAEIAGEPRIDAPRLAGVAPDGTAVALEAERILPLAGQPDGFSALAPRLETRSPPDLGGSVTASLTARLEAPRGEVAGPTRTLRLLGGVTLEASSPAAGPLSARMGSLTADLASGTLTAEGGVEAEGRLGRVRAGGLRLVQGGTDGAGGAARVVFNGGVTLVYHPPALPPGAP